MLRETRNFIIVGDYRKTLKRVHDLNGLLLYMDSKELVDRFADESKKYVSRLSKTFNIMVIFADMIDGKGTETKIFNWLLRENYVPACVVPMYGDDKIDAIIAIKREHFMDGSFKDEKFMKFTCSPRTIEEMVSYIARRVNGLFIPFEFFSDSIFADVLNNEDVTSITVMPDLNENDLEGLDDASIRLFALDDQGKDICLNYEIIEGQLYQEGGDEPAGDDDDDEGVDIDYDDEEEEEEPTHVMEVGAKKLSGVPQKVGQKEPKTSHEVDVTETGVIIIDGEEEVEEKKKPVRVSTKIDEEYREFIEKVPYTERLRAMLDYHSKYEPDKTVRKAANYNGFIMYMMGMTVHEMTKICDKVDLLHVKPGAYSAMLGRVMTDVTKAMRSENMVKYKGIIKDIVATKDPETAAKRTYELIMDAPDYHDQLTNQEYYECWVKLYGHERDLYARYVKK